MVKKGEKKDGERFDSRLQGRHQTYHHKAPHIINTHPGPFTNGAATGGSNRLKKNFFCC